MQAPIRSFLHTVVGVGNLWFIVGIAGCGPQIGAVDDFNAIRACFSAFRDAVETQHGADAVTYVTDDSVERFDAYRQLAISAIEEDLREHPLVEQIEVLRLRYFLTPEELHSFTGADVIARLIDLGILPTPFIQNVQLGTPMFQTDRCFVTIFDDSGPAKEKMLFVKAGQDWKLDIAAMEFILGKVYRGMQRKEQKSAETELTLAELDQKVIEATVMKWNSNIDLSKLWEPISNVQATARN